MPAVATRIEQGLIDARDLRQQAWNYRRQFISWISLSGAGGIVGLLSFSANLPDPDHALHVLLPSLIAFIVCIWASGSVLLALMREASAREHFYHRRALSEELRLEEEVAEERGRAFAPNPEIAAFAKKVSLSQKTYRRWRSVTNVGVGLAILSFGVGSTFPVYIVAAGIPLRAAPCDAAAKGSS